MSLLFTHKDNKLGKAANSAFPSWDLMTTERMNYSIANNNII